MAWLAALLVMCASCASACAAPRVDPPPHATTGDDGGPVVALPPADPATTDDASAIDPGGDAGSPMDDEAGLTVDAQAGPPLDAGPGGICPPPLLPGYLVIDELMIASVVGTGDHGEWLEVRSTRACALNLRGLHGDCPNGARVHTLDVEDDVWIPAKGTFVVADSSNTAINHDLPGVVVVWAGAPGDVLRNKGGTVTLTANGVLVDSVTYPSLALTPGASLAFADDCPPSARSDFTRWQTSVASWFPGFLGTPNAPNVDVHCR